MYKFKNKIVSLKKYKKIVQNMISKCFPYWKGFKCLKNVHRNCKKATKDISRQNLGVFRAKFENWDFFQKKFNSILLDFPQFSTDETRPIKNRKIRRIWGYIAPPPPVTPSHRKFDLKISYTVLKQC